ncbi:MAG: TonB-dependent receptor plug domain-containing protein, partial [Sphingobacterium sp.]|nr:TonB-dependent receptor plug domain-containing protein [Sphingobacterium sp.]
MNFEQQLEKVAIKKTNLFKTILLFIGLMGAWSVKAQNVTLNMRNVPIQDVLKQVSRQTGISILYDEKYFVGQSKISIEVQDVSYKDVLDRSLEKTNLYYEFIDEAVVIRRKKNEKESTKQSLIDIKGVVMDDSGKPISGVSISFRKNKQAGVGTSEDGFFSIKAEVEDIIVFSKVGYETFETNVDGNKVVYNVKLQTKSIAIEDVVVTGLVTRKAESFTGSALTITKEQLFNGGNMNVLQSIKNIDPSFRFADNLDMGSNPNQLPEINLRGKSSMPDLTGTYSGNPNQPLFILDGFETTLQRVYDLDMNRVKSVTLLKDAAAAAIYGAKAGNGVVVIETIPPASGKLRVSYNGNLNIEAPDLTGYNLMNAQQKLDWEKIHNMYYSVNPELNTMRQNLYNQLYQDVYMKGVDTYWLSKPLQVGIGQRHSVIIDGGDDYVRYSVNLMQNAITGVMKESGRNTFSGNSTLSYRHKNLIFTNALTITHNNAKNSPYGEFSDYVKLNPYWTATDETGALKMLLGYYPTSVGSGGLNPTYNPLYNAQLGGVNGSKYQEVIENFYAEWSVLNNLRLKGGLQYMYQKEEQNKFTPPGHTDYINYTVADGTDEYRGLWTRSLGGNQSLESNVGADYSVTAGKHFVMSNITFNINENKNSSTLIAAEGFASNDAADISLGANYQRGSSPSGSDGLSRTLGIMAMTNYAYDNRFLFDGSYRTSASSLYGSNSRWEGFWSLGTGWNLHNEPFVKNLNIFQQLRLRGSIGSTGSQNASSFLTAATYNYSSIVYNGKKGVTPLGIPNPDLQWPRQTT